MRPQLPLERAQRVMRARFVTLCAFILVACVHVSASRARENPTLSGTVQRARLLMGTVCTATVEAADTTTASKAIHAAFDEIARMESILSSWRDSSDISRLNRTGREPFPCQDALYEVLAAARAVAERTDGAYDPTIEPLTRAWDLRGRGRVPHEEELASAMERTGWEGFGLDSETHAATFARDGMRIDLGGIGKGFALDHALVMLQENGARRALLNLGGEIGAFTNAGEWPIAIADPRDRLKPAVRFTVRDAAVSTSGQSERGFKVKGRYYGHILDPRTGRPVAHSGSVTVIATSATQADALSTALFVMGRDDAGAFARRHPDLGVLWLQHEADGLHVWAWNAPYAKGEPGVHVTWMDEPAGKPARSQ